MEDNKINWQIKEYNKMEKTFREVIADIKEGEVWENKNFKITLDKSGFNIDYKKEFDIECIGYVFLHCTTFKLQRKKYTFTEAFKAYEEGEEIESCVSSRIYSLKKPSNLFSANDIRGKWYIN